METHSPPALEAGSLQRYLSRSAALDLTISVTRFYFIFIAINIVVPFPVIFFSFKETNQISLEDIDLLFGERALGTLPEDLHKGGEAHPGLKEVKTREEVSGNNIENSILSFPSIQALEGPYLARLFKPHVPHVSFKSEGARMSCGLPDRQN